MHGMEIKKAAFFCRTLPHPFDFLEGEAINGTTTNGGRGWRLLNIMIIKYQVQVGCGPPSTSADQLCRLIKILYKLVFLIPIILINNKGMMRVFFEDEISLLTDSLMAGERRNGRLNGKGTGY